MKKFIDRFKTDKSFKIKAIRGLMLFLFFNVLVGFGVHSFMKEKELENARNHVAANPVGNEIQQEKKGQKTLSFFNYDDKALGDEDLVDRRQNNNPAPESGDPSFEDEMRAYMEKRNKKGIEQQSTYASSGYERSKKAKKKTYKERLLESKQFALEADQDFTVTDEEDNLDRNRPLTADNRPIVEHISFRASFYGDQRVLPGSRCNLVLTEDVTYGNYKFPKGTFVYANVTIKSFRVLLNVDNINGVQIPMTALDINDRMVGVYSDQAGKLWQRYQAQASQTVAQGIAQDVGQAVRVPLGRNLARSLAQFFSSNRIREKDKILLLNDNEVIITTNYEDEL